VWEEINVPQILSSALTKIVILLLLSMNVKNVLYNVILVQLKMFARPADSALN
jgi:hypothetical protein